MQDKDEEGFSQSPVVTINLDFMYTRAAPDVAARLMGRIESESNQEIRHTVRPTSNGKIEIRAQWQNATLDAPFSAAFASALEAKDGPLSYTFGAEKIRSVSVGEKRWDIL